VCSNPNKAAAKIKHQDRLYNFAGKKLQYRQKVDITYKRNVNRIAIGASRDRSDLQELISHILGQVRKGQEALARGYAQEQKIDEGQYGVSRTANRNQYLALLNQQANLEQVIDKTYGANMDKAMLGISRKAQGMLAEQKKSIMIRPEFGPDTMYVGQSGFDKLKQGVGLATDIASLVTGVGNISQSFKPKTTSWKPGDFSNPGWDYRKAWREYAKDAA
tara:strand:+ start:6887 stop:7543 length:657 start_codon:yes stop_codon:yes gene_type:complete